MAKYERIGYSLWDLLPDIGEERNYHQNNKGTCYTKSWKSTLKNRKSKD